MESIEDLQRSDIYYVLGGKGVFNKAGLSLSPMSTPILNNLC